MLKKATPDAILRRRPRNMLTLACQFHSSTSRAVLHVAGAAGWKSSGNWWNSRSTSIHATGSEEARRVARMKSGLEAISRWRKWLGSLPSFAALCSSAAATLSSPG